MGKAFASSIVHADQFKAVWDAYQDGDNYALGHAVGKLTVTLGGDLIVTILGAKTGQLLSDALKAAPAAATATTEAANAAGMMASSCLRSFDADTPITMANGSTKPIDELTVGDRVLTSDPVTGAMSVQLVDRVWIHSDELVTARIGDRVVVTTPDHPFWNHTRRAWMGLEDFQPGEETLNQNGITESFGGILPDSGHYAAAFNLSVTNTHTFYANHTLVHNCGSGDVADMTLGAGPFAREGVALPDGNINAPGVRELINESGDAHGCHMCGATESGFSSGNWVRDHQSPTSIVGLGGQTGYPQCRSCMYKQAGITSQLKQENLNFDNE